MSNNNKYTIGDTIGCLTVTEVTNRNLVKVLCLCGNSETWAIEHLRHRAPKACRFKAHRDHTALCTSPFAAPALPSSSMAARY